MSRHQTDSAARLPTTSTGSASPRATLLTDLPPEILLRVCEYLVPEQREPMPLTDDELHRHREERRVAGFAGQDTVGPFHLRDFGADVAKADRPNHLANFAATCQSFRDQARWITGERSFALTIGYAGVTFEGIRDVRPLQGCKSRESYADSEHSVAGNIAFNVLINTLSNIKKLELHITIKMIRLGLGRTELFVKQLAGQLSALRDRGSRLSHVDLKVVVGFTRDQEPRRENREIRLVNAVVELKRFMKEQGNEAFAEVAARTVPEVLHPLALSLRGHPAVDIQPQGHDQAPESESREHQAAAGLKVTVKWGDPMIHWGWQFDPTNLGPTQVFRSSDPIRWGSFQLLCEEVQERFYRTAGMPPPA
ncbi:hypothetical protein G647_01807 [Cladophialophora carrionii CBS 160.54]|uniref:F-box domain-containing protein n=1 Tax=Cladophialophora carrionii CBS 160.54 TaxID=1279043 RepID=V9DR34_9EURO|nr:uncharacterized protein G647_01807 [Cladophialophora carrionii CBS 160.54]ETI29354.1 hypothetical protein G647_01807 [Cladophialophora carrionii CBS 160.54]